MEYLSIIFIGTFTSSMVGSVIVYLFVEHKMDNEGTVIYNNINQVRRRNTSYAFIGFGILGFIISFYYILILINHMWLYMFPAMGIFLVLLNYACGSL
ncbi:Transmembrane domain-containing protein [Orpheovirus IHUMI-LCC2]|uniref:Transmembrane domain-containing protein n=1 Tax=Orpheovirus IHUMI-LCC2 TaxID=2023057 RepID=A0A2I2L4C7_9VIRU|nr:Transmembrane domain-containing protein [Orpheovirus IHUMI-LCC2]SNW62405.1 Transmembrane domain-containing protein [Orpheovirus IHUMI-LCC2]